MAPERLDEIATGLARALAGHTPGAEDGGGPGERAMQARILDLYARELKGLEGDEALSWLLRRMAMIEARLHNLRPDDGDPLEEADAPPRLLRLACDAELVQGGFYPAERSAEGVEFRWIGPSPQANVFLPRMRLPLEVRLHVHSAFVPEVVPEVRLSLDGGPWKPVMVREGRDGLVLSAVLEAGPMGHGGLLRLDIDTIRTDSPGRRGGTDGRHLSLALSAIEAESA
ncbi:hypothetical protein [Roseomonas marmotae]|uniref:Uncharacterized protein n=1 Tax=Roseomonas marmotae TaxID=2768161 RepID=A0ABS3KE90_9PROT|nr:hypothetical protein [Roseomonas marmotae]MBO1075793.1 hypothetical protein [Roseomonas marmotae]QTI80517.1 hypothetical protein IAI58_07205 [Roseomonas marmotae]